MEGASADANGGRMALVDSDGSKDDILMNGGNTMLLRVF